MKDVVSLLEPLKQIVQEAGVRLLTYRFTELKRFEKDDSSFATQADIEIEDFLVKELSTLDLSACFFAEEKHQKLCTKSDYCWVIDPLDGTNNFFHGLPHFCISVALTERGLPVLGVIYQPLLDELFYTQKGKGAYLNGEKIQVSSVKTVHGSVLGTCVSHMSDENTMRRVHRVVSKACQSGVVRFLGAAALDQAYVACGRIDGVFIGKLSWWDVAAGSLLIEEAGGLVTDRWRNSVRHGFRSLVGANPVLHRCLIDELLIEMDKH